MNKNTIKSKIKSALDFGNTNEFFSSLPEHGLHQRIARFLDLRHDEISLAQRSRELKKDANTVRDNLIETVCENWTEEEILNALDGAVSLRLKRKKQS